MNPASLADNLALLHEFPGAFNGLLAYNIEVADPNGLQRDRGYDEDLHEEALALLMNMVAKDIFFIHKNNFLGATDLENYIIGWIDGVWQTIPDRFT